MQLQGAACSLASPRGRAPCFLDPLVERVGMLGKLLAQLVILLLPPLFLLQLQFSLLRQKGAATSCCFLTSGLRRAQHKHGSTLGKGQWDLSKMGRESGTP